MHRLVCHTHLLTLRLLITKDEIDIPVAHTAEDNIVFALRGRRRQSIATYAYERHVSIGVLIGADDSVALFRGEFRLEEHDVHAADGVEISESVH
jgi:hypothetical protein